MTVNYWIPVAVLVAWIMGVVLAWWIVANDRINAKAELWFLFLLVLVLSSFTGIMTYLL